MQIQAAVTRSPTGTRAARRGAVLLLGAAVLAVAVRLPFAFTGLGMDEGGYAYVARRWAQGATLYRQAWLDRPQGLLLAYRALLAVDGSGGSVRLGAACCGAVVTVALGVAGWLLVGRRTGVAAAGLYAIAGVAPHLEGFTLNGELLAAAPAATSVAAALAWRRYRRWWWLAAAGLAAGVAVTMKQSGFDAALAGLVVVFVVGPDRRHRLRHGAAFAGAALLPVAGCVAQGATAGLSRYWQALAGYQLAAAGSGPDRWHLFLAHLPRSGLDLAIPVLLAVFGARALRRRRAALAIALGWLAGALLGTGAGGSWWPHYYVQVLPPLVLLAAVAVADRPVRRAALLGATAVLPTLLWLVALVPMTQAHREQVVPYYRRAVVDQRVAAAVRAGTRPGQRIYVLASEADVYLLADRDAGYPYLWGMPMRKIPAALPRLRSLLAGPHRPALVLEYDAPDRVDPSGRLAAVLAAHYRPAGTVAGVPFLRS